MKDGRKHTLSRLFLFFCTLLAIFISISGFSSIRSPEGLVFQLIFLPVPLYLIIANFRQRPFPEIVLSQKKTEIVVVLAIFFILLGLGIHKVLVNKDQNNEQDSYPEANELSEIPIKTSLTDFKYFDL